MIASNLDRMDKKRKEEIFTKAEKFIDLNTSWKIQKFVKFVKNHLHGEKNGKETGPMLFTVAKDVKRIG